MGSFLFGLILGGVGAWLITWLVVRATYRRFLDAREFEFNDRQRRAQASAWQEGFDAGTAARRKAELAHAEPSAEPPVHNTPSPAVQPPPAQTPPAAQTTAPPQQAAPPPQAVPPVLPESTVPLEPRDAPTVPLRSVPSEPKSPMSPASVPLRETPERTSIPVPLSQAGGGWEAAGVVVPQESPLTPEEAAEKRNLRNINLTLATAGLVLLAACAAFLATGFAGALKVGAVGVVMAAFYAGGLFVYARFRKLRPAGFALAGIGLGLVPFFGLALNFLGNLSPAWCWFIASVLGLAGSTVAVWVTRAQALVYAGMGLVLSTLWSVNAVADMPVLGYYVSAVVFAVLVSAVSLLRPGWVPAMVAKSAAATYRYLLPAVIAAAVLSFSILDTRGYALLAALVTLAYALQLPVARGADLVIAYFGGRAAGTIAVLLSMNWLRENAGWPNSFWIAVVFAAFVLAQFVGLRAWGERLPIYRSGVVARGVYVADVFVTFGVVAVAVLVAQVFAPIYGVGPGSLGVWIAVLAAWLGLSFATVSVVAVGSAVSAGSTLSAGSAGSAWEDGKPRQQAALWLPLIPIVAGILANFAWNPGRDLEVPAEMRDLAPFVALALNGFAASRLGWALWTSGRSGGRDAGAAARASVGARAGVSTWVLVAALKAALVALPLTVSGGLTRAADEGVATRAANGDYAAWGIAGLVAVFIVVDLVALMARRDTWLGGSGRGERDRVELLSDTAHVPAMGLLLQWLLGFGALMFVLHRGLDVVGAFGLNLPWPLVAWYLLGAIAGGVAVVRMLPRIGFASALGPAVALVSAVGIASFDSPLPALRVAAVASALVAAGVVVWLSRLPGTERGDAGRAESERVRTIRDSYLLQCELSILAAMAVLFVDSGVPLYAMGLVILGVLTLFLVASVILDHWFGYGAIIQVNRLVLCTVIFAFPLFYLALSGVPRRGFTGEMADAPSALVFLACGLAAAICSFVMVRAMRGQLDGLPGSALSGGPGTAPVSEPSWSTHWSLLGLPYALGLAGFALTRGDLLSATPIHLGVLNPGWTSLILGGIALAAIFVLSARLRRRESAIPLSLALVGAAALASISASFATRDDTPQFFFAIWLVLVALAAVRLGYALGHGFAFLVSAQTAILLSAIFMIIQVRENLGEPWPWAVLTILGFAAVVALFALWCWWDRTRVRTQLLQRERGRNEQWIENIPDRTVFLALPTLVLLVVSIVTMVREQGGTLMRYGAQNPGIDTVVSLAWLAALGMLVALALTIVLAPKRWLVTIVEVAAIIAVWPLAVIIQALAPGVLTTFWLTQAWLVVLAAVGAWEALRSRFLVGIIMLAFVSAGLIQTMITLFIPSIPQALWGTVFALALLALGAVLRRRDPIGMLALATGIAATVTAAQALYQSIIGDMIEPFWLAQWWIIALALLSLWESFRGNKQWGTIGFAVASGALLLSEASTIVFPSTERQVYTLLAMAAVLVLGVLTKSRLFTWMGAVGVAGAIIWFLRGYTFVLLGLLAVALLAFAVLRLRKIAAKNQDAEP